MDFSKNPRLDVFKTELVRDAQFTQPFEMPILKRVDFKPAEGVPFNFAKRSKNVKQWLHFYIYDYLFERVWNNYNSYLPLFRRFAGVVTPDFSIYREMPLSMQIWNTYRNRAVAYWLQSKGIDIVPNVRWGDERTYEFAFDGLEKGGTFAIGTNGCIETKKDRYYFKKGLAKMVEVLEPNAIINYCSKPNDIFGVYEERGIEILTLNYWRDAFRKAAR